MGGKKEFLGRRLVWAANKECGLSTLRPLRRGSGTPPVGHGLKAWGQILSVPIQVQNVSFLLKPPIRESPE